MEIKYTKRPINRRVLKQKVIVSIICGAVFGMVAAFLYTVTQPFFNARFTQDPSKQVVIQVGSSGSSSSGRSNGNSNGTTSDIKSLKQIQKDLYETGEKAGRSVVVFNETAGEGYLASSGQSSLKTGIIFAQNEEQLFILATQDAIFGQTTVSVTFYGGEKVEGNVVGIESGSRLGVVSVPLDSISHNTAIKISVAQVGNSRYVEEGDYVVAIGNPEGDVRKCVVGQITCYTNMVSYMDRQYYLLNTNILEKSNTDGFLIDENGMLIGILTHDLDSAGQVSNIVAIGVSDISQMITRMCNNEKLPFMGIHAANISKATAQTYNLKEGVYVQSVETNSPAVEAGLQPGDVIVEVAGQAVKNGRQLYNVLLDIDLNRLDKRNINVKALRFNNADYKELNIEMIIEAI